MGTHQALDILQGLTTPLFGDRKCPLPQLVHISCDRKYKHTPWPRHGTPLDKCPLSHPRNSYQTGHRQSWKSSASRPAHSQNSVYTLFRLLNIFATICCIVIKFWFTKILHALLKFFGYSFMEHPLTSYDMHFFMGHGVFHSTLNCTLILSRVWFTTANRHWVDEMTVDETGVDETARSRRTVCNDVTKSPPVCMYSYPFPLLGSNK